jgi:hypothetical protein
MNKTTQDPKSRITQTCVEVGLSAMARHLAHIESTGSIFIGAVSNMMEELHAAASEVAGMYTEAKMARPEAGRKFDPLFVTTSRRSGGLRIEWNYRFPKATKLERAAGAKPKVGFNQIPKGAGNRYNSEKLRKYAPEDMWEKVDEVEEALAMIRQEATDLMRLKKAVARRVKAIMGRIETQQTARAHLGGS